MLTDVNLFRMAPPTRMTLNPDPPPPPLEAWQAVMAATNANTQLIMQLLQERNQANQGNQGNQGNNQNCFATLNQFLANQPKTFSNCVEATDADDCSWTCASISSAVTSGLRTLSSSLPSNSKTKLQNGFSSTKIPEEAV